MRGINSIAKAVTPALAIAATAASLPCHRGEDDRGSLSSASVGRRISTTSALRVGHLADRGAHRGEIRIDNARGQARAAFDDDVEAKAFQPVSGEAATRPSFGSISLGTKMV
jgi:hypothetical protein